MFGKIMKSFNRLFFPDRKKKYLETLKKQPKQIPGQLPQGMKIISIQGKEEKYFAALLAEA